METQGALEVEPTVLINIYEVEQGKEEEFFARWSECAEYLKQQDGYISHQLHQSLNAGARFRYVNVAEWQSPRLFQIAVSSPAFGQLTQRFPAKSEASLYRVVSDSQKHN